MPASLVSGESWRAGATLDLGGTTGRTYRLAFRWQPAAAVIGDQQRGRTGGAGSFLNSADFHHNHFLSGQIADGSRLPRIAISLNLLGQATQILNGSNACAGPTMITSGTLLVNGSLGTNTVTVSGGALGGTGVIAGPQSALIQSGGLLFTSPTAIGTLSFNGGLAFSAGSTNLMKLSKAPLTNDLLVVAGTLNYGGTLVLTNLGGSLAGGDSFP